ncbi:hypothetical protein UY3_14245 [Chelonia mydas]|uniref:Ig-like domain-containing protein n=1 Tax=Chelonia mydas TaxID=8469 RepID=M7AZU4_CHEMY|nr:hypothetical protein UY3_14245 [Chelonia mydas]
MQSCALSLSSQEICSAPGALRAPTLYLSPTSVRPGDSVLLQCSMFSQFLATRIIFCKDGEEISSQRGLEKKAIYGYNHVVSGVSSGNYTCGYEIKDSNNRVKRSQLSPVQRLGVSGVSHVPRVRCSRPMGAAGSGGQYVPRPAPLPAAPIGLEQRTVTTGNRDRPNLRTRQAAPPSDFTHGNITRLGLGAMVLLVLGLILAEAYYSCPTGAL